MLFCKENNFTQPINNRSDLHFLTAFFHLLLTINQEQTYEIPLPIDYSKKNVQIFMKLRIL